MNRSSSPEGGNAPAPRSRSRTAGIVLIFIASAAALFGAYAWYAMRKIDYFIARDLRSLSTLTSQITSDIARKQETMKTVARAAVPKQGDTLEIAYTTSEGSHASGTVDLESVVGPLFDQSFLSVFDIVLLATPEGEVLVQRMTRQPLPLPTPLAARSDESKRPPATGLVVTDLRALEQDAGWNSWKPLEVGNLRGTSRNTEVRVMDEDYYLFTQPACFLSNDNEPRGEQAQAKKREESGADLLVCALVPKRKVYVQALSISQSMLAIFLAAVFIALCWFTYKRITLLPSGAPLTPVSVVLAALAALGGAAVLAIAVADAFAFDILTTNEDQQLEDYGKKLRQDILRDILRSVVAAEGLRDWSFGKLQAGTPMSIENLEQERDIWKDKRLWQQPYFQGLVLLDANGQPLMTAVSGDTALPPASMADRAFFKAARDGRWWTIGEITPSSPMRVVQHRYVVEISHGLEDVEAVISVPASTSAMRPIVGVTIPFIHFVDPVVPPGFGFAVIDENGTVIFHSEKQRALNENFFKETDDDRHLRAAMYTRRDARVNGRYWGVDHQLYVAPIPGTPWTAVAMRDETLLRTINIEAIALTILLLVLFSGFYGLAFILLAILNPTYRVPWLWPDANRNSEYSIAIIALILEIVAFIASIIALGPSEAVMIGFIAPFRGLATAFLIMNGLERDGPWKFGVFISSLLTSAWVYYVFWGRIDPVITEQYPLPFRIVVLVLVLVPFGLSFGRPKEQTSNSSILIRKYKFVGMGLLTVAAILPALAFLNTSIRLGVDARVKYTQLRLADLLEKRIDLLEKINVRGKRIAFDCYGLDYVLQSVWTLNPRATTSRPMQTGDSAPRPAEEIPIRSCCNQPATQPPWIPPFIQNMLPRYSESSTAIRELHFDTASERTWRWWRRPHVLTLERTIFLDQLTRERLYGSPVGGLAPPATVLIRSAIPSATLVDRSFSRGEGANEFKAQLNCVEPKDSDVGKALHSENLPFDALPRESGGDAKTWLLFLAMVLIALVLWEAVDFMGTRVFLFGIDKPAGDSGVHRFVESADWKAGGLERIDVASAIAQKKTWQMLLLEVDSAKDGILITNFEAAFESGQFTSSLLTLLEELLRMKRRTIVIASRISIAAVLATQSGNTRERWQRVLQEFAFEHAPAYDNDFACIWSNSSPAERLLLFQISRDGLANRADSDVIRRLLQRKLVQFKPELTLLPEELEPFVLRTARREGISDAEQAAIPPRWQWLKISLILLGIAAVILLFATQKDLINSTSTIITAVAAGIPVILKLIAVVRGRPTGEVSN